MISVNTCDEIIGSRLSVRGHGDPDAEEGRLACVSISTLLATVLFVHHGTIDAGVSGCVDVVLPSALFDWSVAWLEMLRNTYPTQLTIERHDSRRIV